MLLFLFNCMLATAPTFKFIDDLKNYSLNENASVLTKCEALKAIEISKSFLESIDTPLESENSKKMIKFLGERKDTFIWMFNSLLSYAEKMVEGAISREYFNATIDGLLGDLSELFEGNPDILNEFIKISNLAYESKVNPSTAVSE